MTGTEPLTPDAVRALLAEGRAGSRICPDCDAGMGACICHPDPRDLIGRLTGALRRASNPVHEIERRAAQIETLGPAFAVDALTLRKAVSILEQFMPTPEEES